MAPGVTLIGTSSWRASFALRKFRILLQNAEGQIAVQEEIDKGFRLILSDRECWEIIRHRCSARNFQAAEELEFNLFLVRNMLQLLL